MPLSKKSILFKASLIAVIGNTILAAVKIGGGIIAGSLAVVGDGLDTSADIFSSIVTLVASTIIMQPPTRLRPYGYVKADAMASNILSFAVIFAGLQLGISSISKLASGQITELPSMLAIYVTVFSISGKLVLTLVLYSMGRKAKSSMLIANAKNMRGDVIISLAVLVGLFFTTYLKMPILDTLLALVVSIWIVWVGVGIFKENNSELLDGVDDCGIYDRIFDAVKKVPGAYSPHRTRVRKIGSFYTIVLDIEVDGDTTVLQAHYISQCVENMICEKIENVYDIFVHVEPIGNSEIEKFGVADNSETIVK